MCNASDWEATAEYLESFTGFILSQLKNILSTKTDIQEHRHASHPSHHHDQHQSNSKAHRYRQLDQQPFLTVHDTYLYRTSRRKSKSCAPTRRKRDQKLAMPLISPEETERPSLSATPFSPQTLLLIIIPTVSRTAPQTMLPSD